MEPTGAAENLQVIRTLMERSALYRRAMAPVMLAAGLFGVAGWGVGNALGFEAGRAFVGFWFGVAALTMMVALLIVRRQALRSDEAFWTPPTKRIVRAMTPPLVAGFLLEIFAFFPGGDALGGPPVGLWLLLYGVALNSAGLFISRGVRWLGWLFIIASVVLIPAILYSPASLTNGRPHLWLQPNAQMGLTFGLLHLIAAAYLFLTERRGQAAQSSAV